VFGGSGESLDLVPVGGGQFGGRGPALQQYEEHRRAEVAGGDVDRGGKHREQVGAQPVTEAAFVAGGAVVVAGDRAQLGAEFAVGNQATQLGELVQGKQAADPGVLGVVLLLRRPASPGDQVRVDRQHREARIHEGFHQQPVPRFEDDPHLSRVGLQRQTPGDQISHPGGTVLDTELLDHSFTRQPQRDIVMILGPVQTDSQHGNLLPPRRAGSVEAQRRADGPVLAGQHPRRRPTSAGHPRGRRLTSVLAGQARQAFLGGSR
jgi:hypothetical protein